MNVDVLAGTDVTGFSYTITAVACQDGTLSSQLPMVFEVDLLDGYLPGGLPNVTFENVGDESLDGESRHIGADAFVSVQPGCYDVMIQPLALGLPSEDCATVRNSGEIRVFDNQTTEVFFLSQCLGEPSGALDLAVATNNPPLILGSTIEDDKFVYQCASYAACITVTDQNDDPVEALFELVAIDDDLDPDNDAYDQVLVSGVGGTLVGFENGARIWEFCVEPASSTVGNYEWKVSVWDLFTDGTRIEDEVAGQTLADGTVITGSHAELTYGTHTWLQPEPRCWFTDANGDVSYRLVSGVEGGLDTDQDGFLDTLDRVEDCVYMTDEEYFCDTASFTAEELCFTCPNGVVDLQAVYPRC